MSDALIIGGLIGGGIIVAALVVIWLPAFVSMRDEGRIIRAAEQRIGTLAQLQESSLAVVATDARVLAAEIRRGTGLPSGGGVPEARRLRASVTSALGAWNRLNVLMGAAGGVLADPLIGGAALIPDVQRLALRENWELLVWRHNAPSRELLARADELRAATLSSAALVVAGIVDATREGALAEASYVEGIRTVNGARKVLAAIGTEVEWSLKKGTAAEELQALIPYAELPLPDPLGATLRGTLYAAARMYAPDVEHALQEASGLNPEFGPATPWGDATADAEPGAHS